MPVADTSYSILDNPTTSGGGGGTNLNIISSRNTIEVEREGDTVDLNVANDESRNFFVRNFHELMDAIQTIANLYISGDTKGNVIQLLGNIDMTEPTVDDEDNYVLSNGDNLIDIPNKTYNLRQYLRYTKIVSYGAKRALQLLHPNSARTAYDTWQLNVIRFTAENLNIGGDIAAWIGEFGHGEVGRNLPCEYQRYMFSSPGNILYDIKDCYITCCGASQTTPNSFNPFLSMGGTLNAGLWVCSLNMTNCQFIAGRSLTTTDPNLNAPIVINCNWFENRSKTVILKQMTKQVNYTELETGVPNIQIRTDNTASATTAWSSHKWEVTTDGTALIFCVVDNCMVFAPKLALNDLYLEGTPLTPPDNPPTKDYVSLVQILQDLPSAILQEVIWRFGYLFIDVVDDSNDYEGERMTMIPIEPYGDVLLSGMILGYFKHSHISYLRQSHIQRVFVAWDINNGGQIKSDMLQGSGSLRNVDVSIVTYNGERYLSLKTKGAPNALWFIGDTSILMEDLEDFPPITLYYKSDTDKWYSDQARTIEVSFTEDVTAGKFPASLDFGGNTSQVVAGDGTFLNWGDKLGHWTGETANLPPVGSRDANTLYITTDY